MTPGPAGDFDYERHGGGHSVMRRTDLRIAALFLAALDEASTVVDVGAGAGSYEPIDRDVTVVEPLAAMRTQRPTHLSVAVDATAEVFPFPDGFDAAMAAGSVAERVNSGASSSRPGASGRPRPARPRGMSMCHRSASTARSLCLAIAHSPTSTSLRVGVEAIVHLWDNEPSTPLAIETCCTRPWTVRAPDRLAEYHRTGNRHGIDGLPTFDDVPAPSGEAVVSSAALISERAASPSATDRELGLTPEGRSALDVKRRPDQVLLARQERRQQP